MNPSNLEKTEVCIPQIEWHGLQVSQIVYFCWSLIVAMPFEYAHYIYADVLSAQAYNSYWPHVLVKVVSSICTMMMQGNLTVFIPLNAITINGLVYLG